jgi:hypothetical protein
MLQDLEAIKNADLGLEAKLEEEGKAASNVFNFKVNETPYTVTQY